MKFRLPAGITGLPCLILISVGLRQMQLWSWEYNAPRLNIPTAMEPPILTEIT